MGETFGPAYRALQSGQAQPATPQSGDPVENEPEPRQALETALRALIDHFGYILYMQVTSDILNGKLPPTQVAMHSGRTRYFRSGTRTGSE